VKIWFQNRRTKYKKQNSGPGHSNYLPRSPTSTDEGQAMTPPMRLKEAPAPRSGPRNHTNQQRQVQSVVNQMGSCDATPNQTAATTSEQVISFPFPPEIASPSTPITSITTIPASYSVAGGVLSPIGAHMSQLQAETQQRLLLVSCLLSQQQQRQSILTPTQITG